jgi:membrane fusion protein (multidrug efflux system)
VFVIDNGTATRRTVSTGLTWRGQVEILTGLQEGEVVVTIGNNNLRDGTQVRVINEAPPVTPTNGTGERGR